MAQLALLDAMVFFAVSALICSVMMSSVASRVDRDREDVLTFADPSDLLRVFLAASVGEGFALEDTGLELTGREQFGEALLAVASLVRSGFAADCFKDFLSHCEEVLGVLSTSAYAARLQVHSEEPVGLVLLLSAGAVEPDSPDALSACQNLVGRDGTRMIATLVLLPALLPHLVQV